MLSGGPGARKRSAPAHRQGRGRRPPRLSRYSVAHAQSRAADPTVAGRWSALPTPEPDSTAAGPSPSRAAAEPPWRADQGRGDRRRGAGRIRHAVQGADRLRGRRPLPARLFRRVAGRRPVRGRVHRRPAAQLPRRCRSRTARNTGRWCWPPPTRPTPTARRCPGRRARRTATAGPGRAARPERSWCWSTANWCGSSSAAGRSLLSFADDDSDANHAAAVALADLVTAGRVNSILIERINSAPVLAPQVSPRW